VRERSQPGVMEGNPTYREQSCDLQCHNHRAEACYTPPRLIAMLARFRFRTWLPLTQCLLGGIFGLLGAWQRVSVLDRAAFFDQTLWHTTARFHVWPWPYKLALSINLPSFFVGALLASPFVKCPKRLSTS